MPDHILELVAKEYLDIQKTQRSNISFHHYLRNWLNKKGYSRYIKFT